MAYITQAINFVPDSFAAGWSTRVMRGRRGAGSRPRAQRSPGRRPLAPLSDLPGSRRPRDVPAERPRRARRHQAFADRASPIALLRSRRARRRQGAALPSVDASSAEVALFRRAGAFDGPGFARASIRHCCPSPPPRSSPRRARACSTRPRARRPPTASSRGVSRGIRSDDGARAGPYERPGILRQLLSRTRQRDPNLARSAGSWPRAGGAAARDPTAEGWKYLAALDPITPYQVAIRPR